MDEKDSNPYWLDSRFLLKLLESLPSNVFWKDKNGVYLGCNTAFARSLGLENPADVVGKTDYDLPVKKEDSDAYRKDDWDVMELRKSKLNIEEKQLFEDGREAFLLTSKVPLFDKDNKTIGVLGIYSDITNLKNTQRDLLKAKKAAELSDKAKTEFIANMSHDIRTPITGIVGMTQILLNTALSTEVTLKNPAQFGYDELLKMIQDLNSQVINDCNIIMDSVLQLLQLCNEILEVTRLDKSMLDQPLEVFDIRKVVQDNIQLLQSVAREKHLSLTAEIDQHVPLYLKGVKKYVNRILLNLVSNALKFTKTGYVKIKVAVHEKNSFHKDSVIIHVLVEDSGIGIPEDKFETIFENFSRLTPSYEGVYKGSGIGLYAVKQYVELLNGSIEVQSKVGQGSCFKVALPLIVVEQQEEVHPSSDLLNTNVSSNVENAALDHICVLVVEDNPIAAKAVKFALKPLGCTVDIANTGKEAIDKIKNNNYHLVLLDIGLSDSSGMEIAKEIRAFNGGHKAKVPIIALTGHGNMDMYQECLAAGMQEVLSKPTRTEALEKALRKYVPA